MEGGEEAGFEDLGGLQNLVEPDVFKSCNPRIACGESRPTNQTLYVTGFHMKQAGNDSRGLRGGTEVVQMSESHPWLRRIF